MAKKLPMAPKSKSVKPIRRPAQPGKAKKPGKGIY